MPRSTASQSSLAPAASTDDDRDGGEFNQRDAEVIRNTLLNSLESLTAFTAPRRSRTADSLRALDVDARSGVPPRQRADERTGLLAHADGSDGSGYRTASGGASATPRMGLSRQPSQLNTRRLRNHSRRTSVSRNFTRPLGADADEGGQRSPSLFVDDRVWYDQFTSTDWVRDSIADAMRVKELKGRKGFKGKLHVWFDGAQGWIIVALIGVITAGFAYFIDVTEATIFDYKTGYCRQRWYYSLRRCCSGATVCDDWREWARFFHDKDYPNKIWFDFAIYLLGVILLSMIACLITLQTKTTISSVVSLSTLDENLKAAAHRTSRERSEGDHKDGSTPAKHFQKATQLQPVVYYPAAGSGVAEVKVILSGFVLHGYLGVRTLVCKTLGLILSVASGLSIGKEGPYAHISTCIGNIACRMFTKYRINDAKRREVLSASAAAGVAVAFGAPIGGVLFSLEEVSYYFPPKTLLRTFSCCIAAALSLKFLNPYGTNQIVLFEVRYLIDWSFFELFVFVLLGILGGATGALFIKASRLWAQTFRRITIIKKQPLLEVLLVALLTGVLSFWNRLTRLPVAELLYELAAPCSAFSSSGAGLCPTQERIPQAIWNLSYAFVIKALLTVVSFGIKVPAGIYVPSMVLGGLLGRIVGHLMQLLAATYPDFGLFTHCAKNGDPESCVVPGVYALVAAGATMCGVTRLSVTLAVILFELTGSLQHVLPFSLGVLTAKWTADALEPLSIYDLLTDMNAYPYLNSNDRPVFTTDLGDISHGIDMKRCVDISASPLVPAKQLRAKLDYLHMAGELDGGIPILRHGILVGLIAGPDLEFGLDRLESEELTLCLMTTRRDRWQEPWRGVFDSPERMLDGSLEYERGAEHGGGGGGSGDAGATRPVPGEPGADPTDFTLYIDPSPVALDISSSMDLVFECFVKLGLRYICVSDEGRFAGLVHKKTFVKHVKEVQGKER